ncbi:transferrin [Pseudomyrmex gracilis]|uniref:transferrin n=1 Tax=Pseudomyrmex gracilis TaxID=219809 RepID=UPI0009953907|nr:transferrin [Pseudomyrmex gracilis]
MDFLFMFCWLIFTFIVSVESYRDNNVSDNPSKLTMCVVESKHTAKKIRLLCSKLAAQHSIIACSVGTDRFDCIRQVTEGNAHLTVVEPEDLLAIRNYNLFDVLVTNELRLLKNEERRFAVVVIAHKSVQRASDIEGKRLCHPGIATVNDWTKPLSMYFENMLISKECRSNVTLLENRLHALSNYVEIGCVAGPWSSDKTYDFYLKATYKNLCDACNNPAGCYMTDKYYGRQGALLCLTDNVGDVVWARLDDAKVHFKAESVRRSDYKFLCQDGTTKPLDFNQICSWISKPWPVVIAKKTVAENVANTMNHIVDATNRSIPWVQSVLQLLEDYYIESDSLPEIITIADYLDRFPNFLSAYFRSDCQPSRGIVWCVSSALEKRKCDWMKAAAAAYGVEPTIECVLMSRTMCMEATQIAEVDIFMVRPEELLQARKMNLKPIISATTNTKNGMNRIVAIVKENSKFKTILDLKGAKAVFTGYRSVDWNIFVMYMKNNFNESWDCSDAVAVSKFFSQVCVLGARISNLPNNLYSLCNSAMPTASDLTAFTYLTSDVVDVAFVNLKVIENHTQAGDFYHDKFDYTIVNRMPKYRTLGLTVADTLKQNTPYLLAWSSLGSIVTYENITSTRHLEIYAMLTEMDKLFGENFNGITPAFSMYGPFDNKSGVIFPEDTRYLELKTYQMIKSFSYDTIVENIVKQQYYCNSGSTNIFYFLVICLCMMIVELI